MPLLGVTVGGMVGMPGRSGGQNRKRPEQRLGNAKYAKTDPRHHENVDRPQATGRAERPELGRWPDGSEPSEMVRDLWDSMDDERVSRVLHGRRLAGRGNPSVHCGPSAPRDDDDRETVACHEKRGVAGHPRRFAGDGVCAASGADRRSTRTGRACPGGGAASGTGAHPRAVTVCFGLRDALPGSRRQSVPDVLPGNVSEPGERATVSPHSEGQHRVCGHRVG